MVLVVLECLEDPASVNIAEKLRARLRFVKTDFVFDGHSVRRCADLESVVMAKISTMHVTREHVGEQLAEQLGQRVEGIVFASRHRAASGKPALTVHPIGNPAAAEFGGLPRTLAPCMPRFQTLCLRALKQEAEARRLPFETTFESTHHGPYTAAPSTFVEVGSGEADWPNPDAGDAVAAAIARALRLAREPARSAPVLVCFGGGHYAPRFTELALQSDVFIGHMLADHHFEPGLKPDVVKEAIAKTPGATHVYFHRKAIPREGVEAVTEVARSLGLPVAEGQKAFPALPA